MTETPASSVIVIEANRTQTLFCVYELTIDDELIFIGVSKLVTVFDLIEPRTNTFMKPILDENPVLQINIVSISLKREAVVRRAHLVHEKQPRGNLNGKDTLYMATYLVCVETNQQFTTQQEAAEALDINQGQLSSHLAGRIKSVKGYTFKKIRVVD